MIVKDYVFPVISVKKGALSVSVHILQLLS